MISPWSAHYHPMIYSDFVSYSMVSKLVTTIITGDCWWYCHDSHGPPERQRRAASPRRLRPVAPAASWHSAWEALPKTTRAGAIRDGINWLVFSTYPSEKYEFVSWDDYSIYGKIKFHGSKPPSSKNIIAIDGSGFANPKTSLSSTLCGESAAQSPKHKEMNLEKALEKL